MPTLRVLLSALGCVRGIIERCFPALYGQINAIRDRNFSHLDEPELALLPALCDPTQGAVDAGANRGVYSYWLLQHAAWVLAAEPNPAMVRVLKERFARPLAAGRYKVEAAALSDQGGEIILCLPAQSALATVETKGEFADGKRLTVPCIRLDDPLSTRKAVGFIKIDVEGHELAVVKGAIETIRRDHPTLLIEAEERHHPGTLSALRDLLEGEGYIGYYLLNGKIEPMAGFDADLLQNRSALNEAGTKRLPGQTYINNFIFIGRDGVLDRVKQLVKTRC